MRSRRSLAAVVAASLVAVLTLASWSGVALGNRTLTNEGGRTIEATDPTFTITDPGGIVIRCELFIMGIMMEEPIRKMAGSAAGHIFRSSFRNCRDNMGRGVTVTSLAEARTTWNMLYQSFAGLLPEIEEVLIIWRYTFLIRYEANLECLFAGGAGMGSVGEVGEGRYIAEEFFTLAGNRIPLNLRLREGIRRCPTTVEVRGGFSGERVRVTMILT